MWILKVVEKLKKSKIEFALVGGYAVALHGAVRGTVDLDLVITLNKSNYEHAEKALLELGLKSRLPVRASEVFNFREEYIKNKNLIAWSFVNYKNPAEVIHIIITHDLKKMSVVHISVYGVRIPVVSIPSLIKMKKEAGRPQDLEDIKALQEIIDEKK